MLNFKLSDAALHCQGLSTGRMISASAHVGNTRISTTYKMALLQQPLNCFEWNVIFKVLTMLQLYLKKNKTKTSLISINADLTFFPVQESCVNPQMCGYMALKVFFVSTAFMRKHFSTSPSDTYFKDRHKCVRSGVHTCNAFYHLHTDNKNLPPIHPYPCILRKGEKTLWISSA